MRASGREYECHWVPVSVSRRECGREWVPVSVNRQHEWMPARVWMLVLVSVCGHEYEREWVPVSVSRRQYEPVNVSRHSYKREWVWVDASMSLWMRVDVWVREDAGINRSECRWVDLWMRMSSYISINVSDRRRVSVDVSVNVNEHLLVLVDRSMNKKWRIWRSRILDRLISQVQRQA